MLIVCAPMLKNQHFLVQASELSADSTDIMIKKLLKTLDGRDISYDTVEPTEVSSVLDVILNVLGEIS